ncbi:MAG: pseudouridine synthase [Candidatus Acidiferrales bacterium]
MRSAPRQSRTGLARVLSKLGYCSRSQAAEFIRAGRVRLNGAIRSNPEAPVVVGRDRVEIDGRDVRAGAKSYWMLNKPRGIVTTASDEQGRETVYKYLPRDSSWLAPVGRLDKGSEGLLLFTNDSAWAAHITSPESHVDKTYHVQVAAAAESDLLERLCRGVRSTSGEVLRVKNAEVLRQGEKTSWLVVVLDEGKNRQIRRMFEALGIDVLRLVRVAIGNLQLGDLPKGSCRQLSRREVLAVTSFPPRN